MNGINDFITSGLATLEQELQAVEQSQSAGSSQPAQALWQILSADTSNPASFSSFAAPQGSLTQLPGRREHAVLPAAGQLLRYHNPRGNNDLSGCARGPGQCR